eukprot:g2555.t2
MATLWEFCACPILHDCSDHPLRHLGLCLSAQNTEYLQVVQVAQERKKAWRERPSSSSGEPSDWELDLSSLDLFSWLVDEPPEPVPVGLKEGHWPQSETGEAIEHFRLFRGLWRLLELQRLPAAMEALVQVVQYAGQRRYCVELLQREADAGSVAEGWGSSACSTTSTAGPTSAFDGPFCQDPPCLSDSDLSLPDAQPEFDPQDAHAWELQFLCVAAAEDLWRALRSHDLDGAIQVVKSLREEIMQAPPSPFLEWRQVLREYDLLPFPDFGEDGHGGYAGYEKTQVTVHPGLVVEVKETNANGTWTKVLLRQKWQEPPPPPQRASESTGRQERTSQAPPKPSRPAPRSKAVQEDAPPPPPPTTKVPPKLEGEGQPCPKDKEKDDDSSVRTKRAGVEKQEPAACAEPADKPDGDMRMRILVATFGLEALDGELADRCNELGGGAHAHIHEHEISDALTRQNFPSDVILDARMFPDPDAALLTRHSGRHHRIITRLCQHRRGNQ